MTQDEYNKAASDISERLTEINTRILQDIGAKIKAIGQLTPSSVNQIYNMQLFGEDVNVITDMIVSASGKTKKEVKELYQKAADDNDNRVQPFLNAVGSGEYNLQSEFMRPLVTGIYKTTMGTLDNLSQTTGFMMYDPLTGAKAFTPLSRTYQKVIDEAVLTVATGEKDFYSAMRKTLRDLADSGLRVKYTPLDGTAGRTVEYASGYSRRLDTAVRQNILWGVKEINTKTQEHVGEKFGADGYEIDYHRNPRPSHAPMGGKQFVIGEARTIKGKFFESYEEKAEPLLNEYGCLHFKIPIICGISQPSYTDEQLERFKTLDRQTFTYNGKTYTGYEATQMQRKLETAIRHAKDRQIIAKAAGDDFMRRQEQSKINALSQEYKRFSSTANLGVKNERMTVSGYKRVKTNAELLFTKLSKVETWNGIRITGVSEHAFDRAVGRRVDLDDIENALTKPLKIGNIKYDERGWASQRFIGTNATVNVNPETGNIITVWATGERIRKKYGENK